MKYYIERDRKIDGLLLDTKSGREEWEKGQIYGGRQRGGEHCEDKNDGYQALLKWRKGGVEDRRFY